MSLLFSAKILTLRFIKVNCQMLKDASMCTLLLIIRKLYEHVGKKKMLLVSFWIKL